MFMSLRSYIRDHAPEAKPYYDDILKFWIPYMHKYGMVNGCLMSPVRMKRGALQRVGTDAYFVKRLSITVNLS